MVKSKFNFTQGLGLFMLAGGGVSFYIGNKIAGVVLAIIGLIFMGLGKQK